MTYLSKLRIVIKMAQMRNLASFLKRKQGYANDALPLEQGDLYKMEESWSS
jgi:hypothetical protein